MTSLEFDYDMSFPSVGHLDPQRGGCCTVMPYFLGPLVELPLTTTQDYTLFHILGETDIRLWKVQMDEILEHHGLISCLVHPDYLTAAGRKQIYEKLLEYLTTLREQHNIWAALPSEVARWWRQRSRMRLAKRNDCWHVVGPGAERAHVAYASLENGKIRYSRMAG